MPPASEDLDLLLSLAGDTVPETPPGSPSSIASNFHGYVSDDGSPKRPRVSDMSAFREVVKDYLDSEPIAPSKLHSKTKIQKKAGEVETERFSGLRIRNQLVSSVELSNHFSDVRFVRMPSIRNLLSGDTLSGSWATVGVLTEKMGAKVSSTGKNYGIWKMSCLDETDISVFLFGNAYKTNYSEKVGSVFALFNLNFKKDGAGKGFSLSSHSIGQILNIGTSADFGFCNGKRKDGIACTTVINKNKVSYCKYHSSKTTQTYTTSRAELKGGNIRMAFRPQPEGVYVIDPQKGLSNRKKSVHQVKIMSVDGLKKVLSSADRVTTNIHSQGIRFLSKLAASTELKVGNKQSLKPNEVKASAGKRAAVPSKLPSNPAFGAEAKRKKGCEVPSKLPSNPAFEAESKRKMGCEPSGNMIELDIVSSDEDN
ncbi:hypothetical protein KSP40_PGU021334 [Platanthera guangdongensis]|uniref:Zinc finger Mcm10/DnaG-type domain-containing protein n=1 Tax=Platanthera guangdongensis TaxID=2320717 RepID=A0ABR2MU75_9ASPA